MKEKLLKAIFFDTVGKIISSLIMFGAGIVIARTLGPELLGKYLIILGFCGTLGTFTSVGTAESLSRYFGEITGTKNHQFFKKLITEVFIFRLISTTIVSIVVSIFVQSFFKILGLTFELYTLIFIIGYLYVSTFTNLFSTFLQTEFKQKFVNIVGIVASIVQVLSVAYLYVTHNIYVRNLLIMSFVILLLQLIAYIIKTIMVIHEYHAKSISEENSSYQALKKRFIKYSFAMFMIALGGFVLAYQSDVYFISYYLGLTAVGYYSLVNNFVTRAYQFVMPRSIGVFYLSTMTAQYKEKGVSVLLPYFQKNVEYILVWSLPIAIGGALLAPQMVSVIYGDAYLAAVPLFIQMFLISGILKAGGTVSSVFVAMEKPQYFMWSKLLSIINIPLNIVLIQRYGVIGALYATSLTLTIILLVEYALAKKLAKICLPWLNIVKILTSACAMGMIVYAVQRLTIFSDIITLLCAVFVGAVVYFIFVYMLEAVPREYVFFFVSRIRKKLKKI